MSSIFCACLEVSTTLQDQSLAPSYQFGSGFRQYGVLLFLLQHFNPEMNLDPVKHLIQRSRGPHKKRKQYVEPNLNIVYIYTDPNIGNEQIFSLQIVGDGSCCEREICTSRKTHQPFRISCCRRGIIKQLIIE